MLLCSFRGCQDSERRRCSFALRNNTFNRFFDRLLQILRGRLLCRLLCWLVGCVAYRLLDGLANLHVQMLNAGVLYFARFLDDCRRAFRRLLDDLFHR